MIRDIQAFDRDHSDVLRRLWFLGDVHGSFNHIAEAILAATERPLGIIFLGDIDIVHKPLREILMPLARNFPAIKLALIHGNHDGGTHESWRCFLDHSPAVHIHGKVIDMAGIRIAGLGGHFMGRVWAPPNAANFQSKQAALNRGSYQYRNGQQPASFWNSAIYPEDCANLAKQRADILVTHEAFSCHHHGWTALDELARSMHVVRAFHGHTHDDLAEQYALKRKELGFDVRAVNYCSIKNGLGEVVHAGPEGW